MAALGSLLGPFLHIKSVSSDDGVIIKTFTFIDEIEYNTFILFAIFGCNFNNFSFSCFHCICEKNIGYIFAIRIHINIIIG